MTESIFVRGEGGAVFEMDLPLRPDHEKRLAKGELKRVNGDGSPWVEPVAEVDDTPPPPQDGDDPDASDVDDLDAEDADTPPELKAFLDEPVEPVEPAEVKPAAKSRGKAKPE